MEAKSNNKREFGGWICEVWKEMEVDERANDGGGRRNDGGRGKFMFREWDIYYFL